MMVESGNIEMSTLGPCNLVVWYGEHYEYELRNDEAEKCVKEAKRITESVGGQCGMVSKVMITDSGDCCIFEWRFGEGVVFPTREQCAEELKKNDT